MTDTKPDYITRASGVILQVGIDGISSANATSIINEIISNELNGEWKAKNVDLNHRMYILTPQNTSRSITLNQAWTLTRKLESHIDIEFAEPDVVIPGHHPLIEQVYTKTNLRGFSATKAKNKSCSKAHDWSLDKLNIPNAWSLPPVGGKKYGQGVQIAHPDTGYTDHPEIITNRLLIAQGYNFEDNKQDSVDNLKGMHPGHGTSTSSVIFSKVDNKITGCAPKATIVPLRVSTNVIHFRFSNLIKAIYKAITTGSHVISMSLGGPFYSKALNIAAQKAVSEGLILIAAAGNVWPFVVYPAKLDCVIAIAASNCNDKPWKNSARGKKIDVTAPGESVWRARTKKDGSKDINRSNGTSYATAEVAGITALWLAHWGRDKLIRQYGKENIAKVFKYLLTQKGVRKPGGWNTNKYGSGIVNAESLLTATLPTTIPARGFRFSAKISAPQEMSELDEVLDYFPNAPRWKMARILSKTLKVSEDDLQDVLASYGPEFRFHLASNPSFREKLEKQATRTTIIGVRGVQSRSIMTNKQFGTQSSEGLKSLLKG